MKLSAVALLASLTVFGASAKMVEVQHAQGKLNQDDALTIDKAIEYLDLSDIQHKYLDELSGGQR